MSPRLDDTPKDAQLTNFAMEESSTMTFLESLWSQIDLEDLKCCDCGHQIGSSTCLARTFTLQGQDATNGRLCTRKLDVPMLSEVILIYHRHLDCLFRSTPYVAVSHVWDPIVAELQHHRTEAKIPVNEVVKILCEVSVQIYLGLTTSVPKYFEIWLDYVSVPQWQPGLKRQIIQKIPQIFNRAEITIAHFSDIGAKSVAVMREGTSVYERCRGISNMCNAKYFSRVWTTMEYTQSQKLQVMLQDYSLVVDHDVYRPIMEELVSSWSDENGKIGNGVDSEVMVGMGTNLVPWQLGPLELVRNQNCAGIRTMFATAHELLARRGITIPRDFFHALLGILKTDLTESELDSDEQEAILQIARSCIQAGDYSPLFMIPEFAKMTLSEIDTQVFGYLDLSTFALGGEISPPIFKDVEFRLGHPIMTVETIGAVRSIRRIDWRQDSLSMFSALLRLTLESTGLDTNALVDTLGGRFYGQIPAKILKGLSEEDRLRQFRDKLTEFLTSGSENSDNIAEWIAEAMGLSNTTLENPMSIFSPMRFLEGHGGSIHFVNSGALVDVGCYECYRSFLIRVVPLKPDSYVLGATAYRVPGLQYEFTHAGGAGLLVKDGCNVGRVLWGAYTCACPKLGTHEIPLHTLSLPRPNRYEYGKQTGEEHYPWNIEATIKS